MYKIFITILFILICLNNKAQGVNEPVTFSGTTYNIIVHKPSGWNSSQKWPGVILCVGAGEVGTNPTLAWSNGPNYWVSQGWNGEVTLGDSTFKCVIATFQRDANFISPATEMRGIDSIISRYSIDTNRVYITGISRGMQVIVRGYTDTSVDIATRNKYNKFTATVGMSGGTNNGTMFRKDLDYYARIGGSFWYLRGSTDGLTYPTDSITIPMNNARPGSGIGYDWTLDDAPGGTGHCCWNSLYDPSWTHGGLSVYQWLLGHSKRPYAAVGQSVINASGSSVTLNGILNQYSWGYNGWNRTVTWSKISGGSATITSPNSDTTTVTGLNPGTYLFQLASQNGDGSTAVANVTVNISTPSGSLGVFNKYSKWKILN